MNYCFKFVLNELLQLLKCHARHFTNCKRESLPTKFDPDRQDKPNTGEGKSHLYFLPLENETLRESFSKVSCNLSDCCMG